MEKLDRTENASEKLVLYAQNLTGLKRMLALVVAKSAIDEKNRLQEGGPNLAELNEISSQEEV